jgi:hypothetical protein
MCKLLPITISAEATALRLREQNLTPETSPSSGTFRGCVRSSKERRSLFFPRVEMELDGFAAPRGYATIVTIEMMGR